MTADLARAYSLVTEGDGLTYVYNAGVRESWHCVRPYSGLVVQMLETFGERFNNNNGETSKPYLVHEAFKVLLRLWYWLSR